MYDFLHSLRSIRDDLSSDILALHHGLKHWKVAGFNQDKFTGRMHYNRSKREKRYYNRHDQYRLPKVKVKLEEGMPFDAGEYADDGFVDRTGEPGYDESDEDYIPGMKRRHSSEESSSSEDWEEEEEEVWEKPKKRRGRKKVFVSSFTFRSLKPVARVLENHRRSCHFRMRICLPWLTF